MTSRLPKRTGETVTIAGWLHHVRRLRSVTFALIRDAEGIAQVVVEDPSAIEQLAQVQHETVLSVTGVVVATPQAPGGAEIRDPEIRIISRVAVPSPLDLFRPRLDAQLPTLLDHASLALRHPRRRALVRVAGASARGFRETLLSKHFVEIHTPKIVATATEGGANVFAIRYFDRNAYLAQSPQLYKQMMVGVLERVFEIGPVFRAEPHDTPRHLNEYVSLDAEMGFIEDHRAVMSVLRDVIAGMVESVRSESTADVELLRIRLPDVPDAIPQVTFREAMDRLHDMTGEDLGGEDDLAPAHERLLCEWAARELGSEFLFVTGFPTVKRPFYTHPDPANEQYSNSFDLLFRGLELVTGGQRLHRFADYLRAMEGRALSSGSFSAYLEAFQFGMPPHGGFAIGLERWVGRLADVANIREAALFPRDINRLSP